VFTKKPLHVPVGRNLIGRVVDALGNPFDDQEPPVPEAFYPVDNAPPNPMTRKESMTLCPLGSRRSMGF
jgi:flagellum-specific ATP synthase